MFAFNLKFQKCKSGVHSFLCDFSITFHYQMKDTYLDIISLDIETDHKRVQTQDCG